MPTSSDDPPVPALTRTDLAVYQALSSTTVSSPEDLADATELAPRSAARSVDRLTRVGLVTGNLPAAVPPEQALARQVEAAADAAGQVEAAVTTLRTVSASLQVLNEQLPQLLAHQEHPSVELLGDHDTLLTRLASLFATATTSVHGMHPADSTPDDLVAAGLREHRRALRRGVAVRSLHPDPAVPPRKSPRSGPPDQDLTTDRLQKWGAEVRTRSSLPFRMLLFDGTAALCAVSDDVGCSAVVLRGSLVGQLLHAVFDVLWADAHLPAPTSTVSQQRELRRSELADDQQRQLAQLLANGLSDRSIARRLGVTERTVSRRVAALFRHLGATSRFQAGVEAARRRLF